MTTADGLSIAMVAAGDLSRGLQIALNETNNFEALVILSLIERATRLRMDIESTRNALEADDKARHE